MVWKSIVGVIAWIVVSLALHAVFRSKVRGVGRRSFYFLTVALSPSLLIASRNMDGRWVTHLATFAITLIAVVLHLANLRVGTFRARDRAYDLENEDG